MESHVISIVIPAYNEERYLAKCLKSLKEQDYQGQYEIIVVDNGSDDSTSQVARDFECKVVFCPKRGVVYARETGLKASSGEIIVQADADTVYPSNWLSRIAKHFSSHPELVAVSGDVSYASCPLWARPWIFARRLINSHTFRSSGKPLWCLASSFACRREALLKAGGYNTALPFIGDELDLLARLCKVGKVIYDRHLVALSSPRRFRGRFWQNFFLDWFYSTILEQWLFKFTGKSLTGPRSCPREEYYGQLSFRPHLVWSIGVVGVIVSILGYSYFSPTADVFGKTIDRVATSQKSIALTFDDGPNEPYTSQVLDILNSYGVKSTFFVVGKNAEYYPDVARRVVAEGHVIGDHSYTHKPLAEFDVPDYTELDKAQNAIYQVTGVKPHLFRPPYGRKTPWELEYVKMKGLVTVTWSSSANDPSQPPPNTIEKLILENVHPGMIILLHDGNGIKHGSDRSRTVAALPYIIESLKAQGYTLVTVPELIQTSPYIE